MKPAPRIIAVATASPPHVLSQVDARQLVAEHFGAALGPGARLLDVFEHARIRQRHLCVPSEWFRSDHTFAEKNQKYVECAVALGSEVASSALARAGLQAIDVDHVVYVSSTGIATPSIDALIANALGFRPDVRRTPVWGLGCAGGAAGLALARDFATADPQARVLLVVLELCSLSFQFEDLSTRTLVAAALFGDGAAATVVTGSECPRGAGLGQRPLSLLASQSTLWKDTTDVMGWTVDGAGLHVVFSRDIPTIVRERVRPSLEGFLAEWGVMLRDIPHLVAHPGGAKVLEAYAESLGLPLESLRHPAAILLEYGNMSSPSCLFVLERFQEAGEIRPGEHAVVAALGPGFSAEYVLLRGESE